MSFEIIRDQLFGDSVAYSASCEDKSLIAYQALYCDCIYESAFATISTHLTLQGAYNAMKEHRLRIFWKWRNDYNRFRKGHLDNDSKAWKIRKIEILP